jgi:hypothetical protein
MPRREVFRDGAAGREARDEACRRCAAHDSIAALPGEPDEARRGRVGTDDRLVVGGEGAQAAPFVGESLAAA